MTARTTASTAKHAAEDGVHAGLEPPTISMVAATAAPPTMAAGLGADAAVM